MTALHAPEASRPVIREADDADQARIPEASRPRIEPVRRSTLDRMVVGVPLTAAAIGFLIAEAGGADPGADEVGAEGGGPVPTRPEPGVDDAFAAATPAVEASLQDLEGEAVAGGGSAGPAAGSALLPAPDAGAGWTGAADPSLGQTLEGSGEASATGGSEAPVHAGPSVSISFATAPGGGFGTGVDGEPGNDGDERGDIGKTVNAGGADDVIHGTDADDLLSGGAGDDEIHGHAGNDLIDGGSGDDLLFGGAGDDRVLGGDGNDEVHGGTGDDSLHGGSGNDLLFGNAGRDVLEGGAGQDLLDGGAGADRMSGGTGDDVLVVSDLHDVALEDSRSPDAGGADTVRVGEGYAADLKAAFGAEAATFTLGADVDKSLPDGATGFKQQLDPDVEQVRLEGSANHDLIGDQGDNRLIGNDGDNLLEGRAGDDVLGGGAGADILSGGRGDDHLDGGAGDDILSGGLGRDELHGGDGDDLLDGGAGSDRLFGEGGNDTFVLGLHENSIDTVFDHDGLNRIVVEDGEGHTIETAVAGGDLHIIVDKNPIAVVEDYDGASFDGIQVGEGTSSIGDLMAANAAAGPALRSAAASTSPPAAAADGDLLSAYLNQTSHAGGISADIIAGTSAADWLSGLDGDDSLTGAAGNDVLEGGAGSDRLSGGLGDDRYLFRSGEGGFDVIEDAEGLNVAELHGFAGAKLQGVMIGADLWVVADQAPIFKVEQFDEAAFAGIRNGDAFMSVEDLLT